MTPRRRRTLNMALVAVAVMLVVIAVAPHHRVTCRARPLPGPTARDVGPWLALAVGEVPCPSTGRAAYGLRDASGEPVDVLDPIDDPVGGYLGVYHVPLDSRGRGSAGDYRIVLGRSRDLIHWRALRVLDPVGASMPTLVAVPGTAAFLLAYEKSHGRSDGVRLRLYPSRAALLAGSFTASRDLPLRFSPLTNGTPSVLGVDWRGGLGHSVIALGFHYQSVVPGRGPGPDREAVGVLRGFRTWSAVRDLAVDARLSGLGLTGSHGDERQFELLGRPWRVYEAQARSGDFGTWHVVLTDLLAHTFVPLRIQTLDGRFATSFGNPIVAVVHAPRGTGRVLVVTLFVFGAGGASRSAGELVYYQPLAPGG